MVCGCFPSSFSIDPGAGSVGRTWARRHVSRGCSTSNPLAVRSRQPSWCKPPVWMGRHGEHADSVGLALGTQWSLVHQPDMCWTELLSKRLGRVAMLNPLVAPRRCRGRWKGTHAALGQWPNTLCRLLEEPTQSSKAELEEDERRSIGNGACGPPNLPRRGKAMRVAPRIRSHVGSIRSGTPEATHSISWLAPPALPSNLGHHGGCLRAVHHAHSHRALSPSRFCSERASLAGGRWRRLAPPSWAFTASSWGVAAAAFGAGARACRCERWRRPLRRQSARTADHLNRLRRRQGVLANPLRHPPPPASGSSDELRSSSRRSEKKKLVESSVCSSSGLTSKAS